MKKFLFLFMYVLPAVAGWGQSGNPLSGKVTDASNGQALAGCSVFINSTSLGTITAADGTFLLKTFPRGRYDLIISSIGYSTYVLHLKGDSLPPELNVRLQQNATELSAYTVEPYLKDGWQQWGKFFHDNFIGTTENAGSCTFVNHEALRFHFSQKNRRLTVTATEPLIIHNRALGYDLQYQLETFSYDMRTDILLYKGYPLFHEMAASREELGQQWAERRKKAYLGSMHHFIQSLYAGRTSEQGFRMEQRARSINQEKERVNKVYNPNAPVGTYPMDSLYYYWKVQKQANYLMQMTEMRPEELMDTSQGSVKRLFFFGPLHVIYFPDVRDPYMQQLSDLTLTGSIPVDIDERGNYFPSEEMLADGHWAQFEKMCNLVPLDYAVPAR